MAMCGRVWTSSWRKDRLYSPNAQGWEAVDGNRLAGSELRLPDEEWSAPIQGCNPRPDGRPDQVLR